MVNEIEDRYLMMVSQPTRSMLQFFKGFMDTSITMSNLRVPVFQQRPPSFPKQ